MSRQPGDRAAPADDCGYDADADEPSGEVYDTEMHEISGAHIGVNPDETITPFRSGRDGRPN